MDETGPFMILEDYFDDEQPEISFSNMSIDGEYQFSGQLLYCYPRTNGAKRRSGRKPEARVLIPPGYFFYT